MIFEMHIESATALNKKVPAELRGTYSGFCHLEMLKLYKAIGIKKIQIMPVMEFVDEPHFKEYQMKGLSNFFGYNTVDFFHATKRYASEPTNADEECREMIRTLRNNGIEVILDVVYNHVDETIAASWPLWDNNSSGCGHSVNLSKCVERTMASLRHWYVNMGCSGFRFDLAPALGREGTGDFNPNSELLNSILSDPCLKGCTFIAEPWDLRSDESGNMPDGFQEINGPYRDCMRDFFKSTGSIDAFKYNLLGRQNTYNNWQTKRPANFITCHDGYTLQDLVTYDFKNNYANGEHNKDGCSDKDNRSWSRYLPGEHLDDTMARRKLAKQNMMTALLFSLGEPTIFFSDLFSHTAGGNNNTYCQKELNYINYELDDAKKEFLVFMSNLISLHNTYMPALNAAVGKDLHYKWGHEGNKETLILSTKTGGVKLKYAFNEYQMTVAVLA